MIINRSLSCIYVFLKERSNSFIIIIYKDFCYWGFGCGILFACLLVRTHGKRRKKYHSRKAAQRGSSSLGSVCWSLAKKLILLFAVAGVALNVDLRRLRDQFQRDAEIDKQLAHEGLRGLQSEEVTTGKAAWASKSAPSRAS